jgi:hypothetical protein
MASNQDIVIIQHIQTNVIPLQDINQKLNHATYKNIFLNQYYNHLLYVTMLCLIYIISNT